MVRPSAGNNIGICSKNWQGTVLAVFFNNWAQSTKARKRAKALVFKLIAKMLNRQPADSYR